jgi:hypothetical protein
MIGMMGLEWNKKDRVYDKSRKPNDIGRGA